MHAFVTYDDIRDAEDAKRELDKTEYAAPAVSRRRQGRCGSCMEKAAGLGQM